MDRLLVCERCQHGAIGHASTGCEVATCDCASTREHIIERAVQQAMEEIREQYRRST